MQRYKLYGLHDLGASWGFWNIVFGSTPKPSYSKAQAIALNNEAIDKWDALDRAVRNAGEASETLRAKWGASLNAWYKAIKSVESLMDSRDYDNAGAEAYALNKTLDDLGPLIQKDVAGKLSDAEAQAWAIRQTKMLTNQIPDAEVEAAQRGLMAYAGYKAGEGIKDVVGGLPWWVWPAAIGVGALVLLPYLKPLLARAGRK